MMDDDDEDDGWAHAMREVDGVDGADALEDEPRQYGDGNDDDDADVFGEEARSGNLDAHYEPVDSEVMRLKRAWVQERLSPEMLPHEGALWEAVKEAVETQEDVLTQRASERAERGGSETDVSDKVLDDVMWMEVNRVKYLLREYLRTRLVKIEAHDTRRGTSARWRNTRRACWTNFRNRIETWIKRTVAAKRRARRRR